MNDGGSAFPWQVVVNPGSKSPFSGRTMPKDEMEMNIQVGLTLRDYIAVRAMQGILSQAGEKAWPSNTPEALAQCAYQTADAMISEREKSYESKT